MCSHVRALFFVEYDVVGHKNPVIKALYLITGFGHEAVVVFFVLSGFFISSSIIRSVLTNQWSWAIYAQKRLIRLYVVLVPALLLGLLWDMLGSNFFSGADIYQGAAAYTHMLPTPIMRLLSAKVWFGNLFFLQGIRVPTFGSNGPLWSLSYEFWYYVLFPLSLLALSAKTPAGKRLVYFILALGIAYFIGHRIDIYFLVWLMGVIIVIAKPVKLSKNPLYLPLTGLTFLVSLLISRQHRVDGVAMDFVIGIAFSAFLYGLLNRECEVVQPVYKKSAQFLSEMSYTLYLVHVPFLVFLNAMIIGRGMLWQPTSVHLTISLVIGLSVFGYAYLVYRLTEAKTDTVRRIFNNSPFKSGAEKEPTLGYDTQAPTLMTINPPDEAKPANLQIFEIVQQTHV